MKLRYAVISASIVLLLGASYAAHSIHRMVATTVPNAYAMEWVGSMVVEYLDQNDGRWPRSWDDLHPIYEQHVAAVGQPWTFEDMKSRVRVRWDVDVDWIRQLPAPPDDLIVLRDGGDEHWSGHEPNTMVHAYLTEPPSVANTHTIHE